MYSRSAKQVTLVLVSLACASLGCNGKAVPTRPPTNMAPPTSEFPSELAINPDAIPPADVLEQVDFMVPLSGYYSCTEGITGARDPLPIGEPIEWCFCAVEDEQTFTVKLIDPNGVLIKQADFKAYISDFSPCHEGGFPANLLLPGVPLGLYRLEFTTPQSTLTIPFTLTPADKPTILQTDTEYILTGFRPGEEIRLLAYEEANFAGEWWRQADQNGELRFKVNSPVFLYAIGAQSGEASRGGDHTFARRWINYTGSLDHGASIQAAADLPLYEVPSNENPAVATLPAGTRLLTTEGPFSNNGAYWWQVKSEAGTQGWADERLLRLLDYEPNDSLQQAADLIMFETRPYSYNRYSKLSLGQADRDFYRLPFKAGPRSVTVGLDAEKPNIPPIGMVLYDDSGQRLGEKSITSEDDYISLTLTVPEDGTYYLEVYDNGIAQPIEYRLTIY